MIPLSTFSIAAMCRSGEKRDDGTFTTERHFWDFVIDGQS